MKTEAAIRDHMTFLRSMKSFVERQMEKQPTADLDMIYKSTCDQLELCSWVLLEPTQESLTKIKSAQRTLEELTLQNA